MLDDVLGDRRSAARRAPARVSSPRRSASPSRIFRLTSWSEQSTPAELSMKSALMRPPPRRVLDARAAREAEVAALPHDAAAQLARVDADRVARAVGRVGVGLVGRLDDGADAAVPQQVDRRAQDRADDVVRRAARSSSMPERLARLRRQRDRLRGARADAAALGDQLAVVVVPGGAGELEQPLALREADAAASGVGVDEDVPVVVGGDQPDRVATAASRCRTRRRDMSPMPDDGELVGLRCRRRARGSGA